ncbi:DNA polymerase III subunit gamma/tau, partial [filamentous cyanobacterium CCP4]
MAYEPLHHKYRPQTFGALVGQDAIATTLANALHQQRIAPAYLFCGPRGTGKTSSARILAKSLNCIRQDHPTSAPCGTCETCRSITNGSALDFIEIDAASNTGVDNIRELIERAQFAPVQCRYKVYVIDECHMLSTAAFNALLKTLEEPPSNVVFILATTDPQRVLPTIISRCQRFDYRRIPLEPMIGHLRKIADLEEIAIDDEALRLVAQVSQGGLRDAQSLLDQLSLLEPPVSADAVWDLVGAVPERDLLSLVQAILSDDGTTVLDSARKLMDRGREPLIVLQNLAGFYRDLLIAKTAGDRQDLVAITPPTWADMQTLVQNLDPKLLLLGQQHLRAAEGQVKNTTQPRLWLEVTLLGLLPSTLAGQAAGVSIGTTAIASPPTTGAIAKPTPPVSPSSPPAPPAAAPAEFPSPVVESTNGSTPEPPSFESAEGATPAKQPPEPVAASGSTPHNGQNAPPPDSGTTPTPNLEQIWLQVIAVLEPLGTRALMQQQGSLLFYDGVVARVGISSRPLFKMAQGRVENVEAAFQKVLNQKVQVSLEVLPDPKPESPAPAIAQAPGQAIDQRPASVELPPA